MGQRIDTFEAQTGGRVAYLTRLGSGLIPQQNTVIQEGDFLSIIMREDGADKAHQVLASGPEAD